MLVDTHCHLDQFPDPAAVLDEAAAAGVGRVVAVSEDAGSMRAVLDLKQRFPDRVLAGLGLHPARLVQLTPEQVEEALLLVEARLKEADVLGEAGLDHRWAETDAARAAQEAALQRQLEAADRCQRPVNLHSRRCLRQTMERAIDFHRATGLGAQLHWFTHSRKLIGHCNDAGIFVSVGPTVIGQRQTQEVVAAIDSELLLLETDAPVAVGGTAGHPARLREVAAAVAHPRGWSEAELAHRTSANFARFLGRPAPPAVEAGRA